MESYHKNTTIKNCGKLYSGPDNQIRTGIIFPFRTIYPDNNKPPQSNQDRFTQDMEVPHRCIDQESSRKIDEHNNGTPTHEITVTVIN